MTALALDVTHEGTVAVARLEGEIDLSNASQLTETIPVKMSDSCSALLIDLAAVTYIDSAGIGGLFALARRIGLRGQAMALAVPDASPIIRMLTLTHVNEVAVVRPSVDDALQVLAEEA